MCLIICKGWCARQLQTIYLAIGIKGIFKGILCFVLDFFPQLLLYNIVDIMQKSHFISSEQSAIVSLFRLYMLAKLLFCLLFWVKKKDLCPHFTNLFPCLQNHGYTVQIFCHLMNLFSQLSKPRSHFMNLFQIYKTMLTFENSKFAGPVWINPCPYITKPCPRYYIIRHGF